MEAPVPANLEELVKLLNETLGSKGLDDLTEREIDYVKQLMSNYTSQANDWKKYSHFDPMKYTRNLVDDGNGKFNLMVLCWNIGQVSSIHNHAGSHCIMKMLDGELLESQYEWPEEEGPMHLKKENIYKKNEVTYINDTMGLHRIENPSHVKGAISLHLYTPAYSECKTFVEESGHTRASGKMTFYTVDGKKVNYCETSQ